MNMNRIEKIRYGLVKYWNGFESTFDSVHRNKNLYEKWGKDQKPYQKYEISDVGMNMN